MGVRNPPAVTLSDAGKTGPKCQFSTRSRGIRGGTISDMGSNQEITSPTSDVKASDEFGKFPKSLSASTLSSSLSLLVAWCGLSWLVEGPASVSFRRVSKDSVMRKSGFGQLKSSSNVPCQDSEDLYHPPIWLRSALRCPFFGPLGRQWLLMAQGMSRLVQTSHLGCVLSQHSFLLRHSSHFFFRRVLDTFLRRGTVIQVFS